MRKVVAALVVVVGLAVPVAARAGWVLEGSIGSGIVVESGLNATQTNLMIAPGVTFAEMLRLELGFLGSVSNNAGHQTFEVRPMLVIAPPILPLYGRLVVSTMGDNRNLSFDLGAALGLQISLAGIGLFAEAGYVPRTVDNDRFRVLEGRAGTFFMF